MSVEQLLGLIPEKHLEFLSTETKVDHQVKKLTGVVIFKLVLFSMLSSQKVSLRVMESILQSARFKQFAGIDEVNAKYNSIRDRICTINADFFKQLFETVFELYNKELKEAKAISKADSTYVSIAASLVDWNMRNGHITSRRHVKYSVTMKGSLPCNVKVYTEKKFISESIALGDLLNDSTYLKESVVVFDRGLTARKSFENLTNNNVHFVGRCQLNYRCIVQRILPITDKPQSSNLTIEKDEIGFLIDENEKQTTYQYRIISATIDQTGEAICFITNLLDENAYTIAATYKERWGIEVFFKFIKQHLNVNHLVVRKKNGIEVMLYMTMIAAILILVFKKQNKIKGYKIAKLKFEIQLDNLLIKEIVTLCGGNPDKASHLWNTS